MLQALEAQAKAIGALIRHLLESEPKEGVTGYLRATPENGPCVYHLEVGYEYAPLPGAITSVFLFVPALGKGLKHHA